MPLSGVSTGRCPPPGGIHSWASPQGGGQQWVEPSRWRHGLRQVVTTIGMLPEMQWVCRHFVWACLWARSGHSKGERRTRRKACRGVAADTIGWGRVSATGRPSIRPDLPNSG